MRFASAVRRPIGAGGSRRGRWALGLLLWLGIGLVLVRLSGCRAGATRGEILYADALEQLAAGDSAGALQRLEGASYEMPADARVQHLLGQLLARQGSIESRAQAERALRRAVELAPANGAYAAALGGLLSTQGFWGESQSRLRQALQLDPHLGRAWFDLGLLLERDYREDPLSAALCDSVLACFERAVDADPANDSARYRLAYLLQVHGQPERARAVLRAGPASPALAGRFLLLESSIEFRSGHLDSAGALLDSALAHLHPAARDSLLDPRWFAPDSVPACDPCPRAQMDSLAVRFWWLHDPTPTTWANERLLEHVARVVTADYLFAVPALHHAGRDTDRGAIYIRYGPPDAMSRELVRDPPLEVPAWRWFYWDLGGQIEDFLFVDRFFNTTYLRFARGAQGDFATPEVLDRFPEKSSFRTGPPAPGWRHGLWRFRGSGGRAAVELAYEFELDASLDSLQIEVAAWDAPGHRLAARRTTQTPGALHVLPDGRAVGRVRFEFPCGDVEIGLQATAWGSDPQALRGAPPRLEWTAVARDTVDDCPCGGARLEMSDLLLAHVLRAADGGPFDLGGNVVVPRLEHEITSGRLHLFFEIYPGGDGIEARRPLQVTYRVQARPPRGWRFRDQFSAAARARRERRTAVESTFRLEPRRAAEPQRISIDVRNLDPGDYALVIEVRDAAATALPVQRSIEFSIPAAPGR